MVADIEKFFSYSQSVLNGILLNTVFCARELARRAYAK